MHRKGITAVVAIVLLLMMTVAAAGLAYMWVGGMQTGVQKDTTTQAETIQQQASDCMKVDNTYASSVYIRNCGNGVIRAQDLLIYVNGLPANYSLQGDIEKGEAKEVKVGFSSVTDSNKIQIKNIQGGGALEIIPKQKILDDFSKDASLVGYWKLDEGSGPLVSDTVNKYNRNMKLFDNDHFILGHDYGYGLGICSDPPTGACPKWVTGKTGYAVQLDGSAEYIRQYNTIPDGLFNSFTMSAWFKTSGWFGAWDINSIAEMYSNGGEHIGIGLESHSGGGQGKVMARMVRESDFSTYLSLDSSSNGIDYDNGNWHNAVLSFDNPTLTAKLYVDGNKVSEGISTGSFSTTNNGLFIGSSIIWSPFDGTLDEVRTYNRALTDEEVKTLYELQK